MLTFDHFRKIVMTAVAAAVLSFGLAPLANASLVGDVITLRTVQDLGGGVRFF